jgi:O-acetyl-ADP-ribose deacetylase (regulator of RNase III)
MRKVATILADITMLGVDVIVNAANEDMRGGGGVDGAIHEAAGPELVRETVKAAPLYVSKTLVTSGFNLKASHIIHTVGPQYHHGNSGEYIALEMCYRNVLKVADGLSAKTIAIPAISSGVYRFPKDRAAKIAVETCIEESAKYDGIGEVLLVAYDESTYEMYKSLLADYR